MAMLPPAQESDESILDQQAEQSVPMRTQLMELLRNVPHLAVLASTFVLSNIDPSQIDTFGGRGHKN